MNKEQDSPTPYDDVFKALVHSEPKLFIAVINRMFHQSYPPDVSLKYLATELHGDDGKQHRKVTADSCLQGSYIMLRMRRESIWESQI